MLTGHKSKVTSVPLNEQGSPKSRGLPSAAPNSARQDKAARPGRAAATVLVVSPNEADHEFFSSIFQLPYWTAYRVGTYREALRWLTRDRMTIIICDSQLPDGGWKDILSQTQILPDPPCVIVTSRLPDDLLRAEVLNLGGYDLLAKPFVREETVRIAELASMNWHREPANGACVAKQGKEPQLKTSPSGKKPRTAAAG